MSERPEKAELKPSEAADMLGVDATTIRSWIRDGILPARRTRPPMPQALNRSRPGVGHWRIRREDVEALQRLASKPDARVLKRQAQEDRQTPTA
jgi:predicted site-specific integrase-resolvase